MISFRSLTKGGYIATCALDAATTIFLINILGYGEHNILFNLLGQLGFWVLYAAVSIAVYALMLKATKTSYAILWIPAIAHLTCGAHNILIF
jgi:hypothetical protein